MNNAYGAYTATQKTTASTQQIEARVFGRVISDLSESFENYNTTGNKKPMIEALHNLKKLWNILLLDLSHETNKLPDDLKANLISLGLFVDKATTSLMSQNMVNEEFQDKTILLLDINRNVASGLMN